MVSMVVYHGRFGPSKLLMHPLYYAVCRSNVGPHATAASPTSASSIWQTNSVMTLAHTPAAALGTIAAAVRTTAVTCSRCRQQAAARHHPCSSC
jgi:hypothetical protein